MNLVDIILIMAALSCCLYIVAEKWGLIEWLQVYHKTKVPGWFPVNCAFCLMFWICVILLVPILIFSPDISYLAAPLCAAPIAKAIYENCRTPER